MKQIRLSKVYATLLMLFLTFLQIPLWAQDQPQSGGGSNNSSSTNVTTTETTTTTTTWYTEPWVWIVGGAVLLLIIIALVRGSNSSDREVSRTTVIKE